MNSDAHSNAVNLCSLQLSWHGAGKGVVRLFVLLLFSGFVCHSGEEQHPFVPSLGLECWAHPTTGPDH